MDTVAMEEAEQGLLAIHDEVRDWAMKRGHNEPKHQSREIAQHAHTPSVAIGANVSIGRRA